MKKSAGKMIEDLETQFDMLSVAYAQECANHDKTRAENKKIRFETLAEISDFLMNYDFPIEVRVAETKKRYGARLLYLASELVGQKALEALND